MHRIILIGLRATGKSSVGRELVRLCGGTFLDLDDAVSQAAGASSAHEAFVSLGEPAFRTLEARALADALRSPSISVIALGGGTPMAPGAEATLRTARADGWRIVLLNATDEVLAERIRRSPGTRPSLTGALPDQEVAQIRTRRWSTYESLAETVVDTGARNPSEIAQGIVSAIG
ncbi:MAG: shikimate kinase [Phycisphaerae bacterium]|nr:shikimate kinase [Phycisphaerae bacterium]